MTNCPTEDALTRFVEGRLDADAAQAVRAHLDGCPPCLSLLTLLGRSGPTGSSMAHSLRAPADLPPLALDDTDAAPDPRSAWAPPPEVDEFRLLRPLGRGAMGLLFLARDTALDRDVAIKFIAAGDPDADARDRFRLEARAIARLSHPNVVSVHRVGEVQGRPYLVSGLIRGKSLDQLPLPLPWERVLRIGLGLARGLAAAHRQGVLHRDIKPANAILADDGEVKLLDFGLAKLLDAKQPARPSRPSQEPATSTDASPALTRTGALVGTPLYMAPEIWRREPVTAHSDVYSLGVLLFELAAGRTPHLAETREELARAVQDADAPPLREVAPQVDPRLAALIDRCLSREPERRFASAEELCQALEELAGSLQARSLTARSLRRWAAVAVATVLVLAVAISQLASFILPARSALLGKGRRTVAVLGFQNLGGQADTAWISPALSDLLGAELAAGDHLRMVPAESVCYRARWIARSGG